MNKMPLTAMVMSVILESGVLWILLATAVLIGIARSARVKGAIGELRIRFATDFLLNGKEYHPLHNVTLRTPDGTTQIDHIIVSRYGIFVVETKNLNGWIFGDSRSRRWTQALFRRKFQFQNPLHQNFKHVKAVEAQSGVPLATIHSVVVFVGRSRFKTLMPDNVVKSRGLIRYIRSMNKPLLNEAEVREAVGKIKRARLPWLGTTRKHVRGLKQNAKSPICPRCGGEMVLRTARRGTNAGSRFWGCSNYPKCRAVKQVA